LARIKSDAYVSMRDRAAAAVNTAKAAYEGGQAQVTQSEAEFKRVQLSYDRSKKLFDQQTISQADWDAAISEFAMSKARLEASKQNLKSGEFQVKSAEASLKEASDKLNKTSVYAPINGVITKLIVEQGERVAGTDMMKGTDMMRLADLNRMEAIVDVNENDIVHVNINDTAIIEVDAYIEEKFKGLVTEIAHSANTSGTTSADQVTSFEVKILLLESSYKHLEKPGKPFPFRPGMSVTVDIQTDKRLNTLSVPIQAVTARTDSTLYPKKSGVNKQNPAVKSVNDKPYEVVFVADKGKAVAKKVKTGIQDNSYIEILEGLSENDEVITAPYNLITKMLKDGSPIKVIDKSKIFKEK